MKRSLSAGLMLGVAGMFSSLQDVAYAPQGPQRMHSGNDWNGRTSQKDKALVKRRKANKVAKSKRKKNRC